MVQISIVLESFFANVLFIFRKGTCYIIIIHIVLSRPNMMTKDILKSDKV